MFNDSSLSSSPKRILIVAPLDLQISGNNTTVVRLGKLLRSSEYHVDVKSCCVSMKDKINSSSASSSAEPDDSLPLHQRYDCFIGLHALRCAKWLLMTEGQYLTKNYANNDRDEDHDDMIMMRENICKDESNPCTYDFSLKRRVQNPPQAPGFGGNEDDENRNTSSSLSSSSSSSSSSSVLRPFILIFGGTDINEFSKEPSKVVLMKVAVDRAAMCVCFSSAIKDRAMKVFPSTPDEKFVIIPQTVDDQIWSICQRLMRSDHEFDDDVNEPREIDQVIYEAQQMQFEREKEEAKKIASSSSSSSVLANTTSKKQNDSRSSSLSLRKMITDDPRFETGWRHSEWLTGDSARRWIVMPAGVRKVKNQLAVLQMVVEMNRIAMKREVNEILSKTDDVKRKEDDNQKQQDGISILEKVISGEDVGEKKEEQDDDHDESEVKESEDESTVHCNNNDDHSSEQQPLAEWGLLLLGPEIEKDYTDLIEVATSWFLHKHQANTIVLWHRTGISPERLCRLLFDGRNKVSLVINSSFSEGQPQAIMEAMVVTAIQRQKEKMEEFERSVKNDDKQNLDTESERGFLCAITDCPGNLAVMDETCGIVLPFEKTFCKDGNKNDVIDELVSDPTGWAERIDREFFLASNKASRRTEKRDEAAKRANEQMQSITEMLEWKKLIEKVLK